MKYDYLVVGAGLYGATFARMMTNAGYKVLVIDKRDTVGGNAADYVDEGITVHKYGAHIFHTNSEEVWNFVNRFATFTHYQHNVKAMYHNRVYSLPFNMNTFTELFGVTTPDEAKAVIMNEIANVPVKPIDNLEQKALTMVGPTIYKKLIKGYTEKQWGRPCDKLSPDIISRLPMRWTYNNNYFNDFYQGFPIGGYTKLVKAMLNGIDVQLNTDLASIGDYKKVALKMLYTGPIDALCDYKLGTLQWRSLRFDIRKMHQENFQGCPVMNYTESNVKFTRIIEFKHFLNEKSPNTVVCFEFPKEWRQGDEPYYPINDIYNTTLYESYAQMLKLQDPNILLGGRLGLYKYFDMDKTIIAAMHAASGEIYDE